MSDEFHHKMVLKYGMQSWLPEGWVYKPARTRIKKLVEGVGINDVEFSVQPTIEGKRIKHPAYSTWHSMLHRAYSDKYKITNPTYTGVEVHQDWHIFSNFLNWFQANYVPGYDLDKDILVDGNKIYNPEACLFVPQYINSFLTLHNAKRGVLPIGVSAKSGKYESRISGSKHRKHLGYFDTPALAHKAWQKAKLEQAIAFDFPALARVITKLKYHIDNDLIIEAL